MDISTKSGKEELIRRHTPRTRTARTVALAFLFGGGITALGEALRHGLLALGAEADDSFTLVSLIFILLAAVLTAVGVFDRIARHAGAGTLVPITGFSNSITSEAMDSASEGYILGVGAKIFTVAGPVLLYGTAAGVVYGVIYYLSGLIGGGA